jgi:5-methylcytosine-specific restriction endonuclease McrA
MRISYILLSEKPTLKIGDFYRCKNCGDWITDKRRKSYCNKDCAASFFREVNHDAMRTYIIHKRGQVCEKCGKAVKDSWNITLDHIIPIALGGQQFGDPSNLQLLCPDCNREKTSKDISVIAREKRISKIKSKNRCLNDVYS